MRALVTGAAGFIGSHLTDALLQSGAEVLAMDDLSTGRLENLAWAGTQRNFDLVHLDIATAEAARVVRAARVTHVFLLGAQMSVKTSMKDPVLDARTNAVGIATMLSAAADAGARKAVFASSGGTIYGAVPADRLPIRESEYGKPASFYGLTKRLGTDYVRLFAEHRGLPGVALALGNVYGPRQDPAGEAGVIAIFLERMIAGVACRINGTGTTTRDFVHVDDVVQAFVAAAERGSGTINIGTGVETSVNDVYSTLAGHFPDALDPEHAPALSGEVPRVSLSNEAAKRELGWSPTVVFADGIEALVAARRPA